MNNCQESATVSGDATMTEWLPEGLQEIKSLCYPAHSALSAI